MSVDAEFPYGPSTLVDEELPAVRNSDCAGENASSSEAVTKETLNGPVGNGQMVHNTASAEITCIEELSGKSAVSDKSNDDEKLIKESAEAAKADGNSEDKLQLDQTEHAENAENDGQGTLIMVTKVNGVNEIGGDFDGDVTLVCEESADIEKVENDATVTEIKAVGEIRGESNGSRENDKILDSKKADDSSVATNPITETVGMEEMRGESNSPHRSSDIRRSSEESTGAEKADNSGQRMPQLALEMTRVEQMGCLSSSVQKSSEDKSQGNQGDNVENEDSNGRESSNMVLEIKGINEMGGDSNGDVKLVCEESAVAEKLESNSLRAPSIDTEATPIEEVRPESFGSSKIDENVDAEKAGIDDSMATVIVPEINGREGESNGAEKINIVTEITRIEVESNGAGELGDDKPVHQESTNTEKAESQGQRVSHMVSEIKGIEEAEVESDATDKADGNSACEERKCLCNIVPENNGLEGESNGAEKMKIVTETTGIEVESNGAEEISDDKLVYQESTHTEKVENHGQRVSHMVSEVKGIEEAGESDATDKTDENSTCEDRKCVSNIVTEINGLAGESNGAEKINIVTEITGIEVESIGAEAISDDKLVHEESTNAGKAETQGKRISHMVGEIKGIEETEGESDGADKKANGSSTCEERKDAEVADSGSPVHEGEILCSIGAVTFGKENLNRSVDDVQSVGNTVFDTPCNEEIGRQSDDDKDVDDKAIIRRCENSESSHIDGGLGCEGRDMSSNDAIEPGNETCNSCISHDQSPPDMCQEIIDKAVGGESNGVDRGSYDSLMCEESEDDKRFSCSSPGAEGISSNAEVTQGLSTLADSELSEVGNYCASSTKDVFGNDSVGAKNDALNSCADDSQLVPDLVREGSGVEKSEGELNGADTSIDTEILYKKCEDPQKSRNSDSDNVGVPTDAEFSIDQSVLADVKLCKSGNSSASSTEEVCRDVVCGNTLNESEIVPKTTIEFTGIMKEEGESSVADQTSDDKIIHESADAEKSPSINSDERMSFNAEICHDQTTLADLESSEAGKSSASSSRNVSSIDAVTFGNETLTCPIKINQESANRSIDIADTEEKGGGSDRRNDDKLMCEAGTGEVGAGSDRSNNDKLICEQRRDAEISNTNEVLTTSAENSSVDAVAVRDMNGSAAKGFYFLIRMPRFDDEKLRERIKVAELNVDEKTQHRDAFRQKIRNKRANCQTHGAEFEAAKTQERDARKQVRTKRADISTLQDVIDKAKNAVAIEEIDTRIRNMEHIIGHETLPLKEEKLIIREIKQLKQLRGQLSSNIGSQDEVQKALDERDVNEERLRILKKELDNLKVQVSKAETIAIAASRKYEDESRKLKELQTQFKAADDIRQEAYEELRDLKKGFYEKNIHFRTYKDEATLASDYARKREMEALNSLCMNQVERYMELWNKNDEFRKEYIRCNTRSTLRRFGTFDGRTLGPDEEPTVLPSYAVERVNRLVANVDKVNLVSQTPTPQQVKQVVVFKKENKDDKIMLQAAEGMNQIEKTKEARKPIQTESSMVDEQKEAEHLQTAQELEAARKEEERRKLEAAIMLKEQRRLEEIAKAKEALERKRRNAEKAQQRAELRAQKEEEQRLKEREKRLRKKERKKVAVGENDSTDGDNALVSTSPNETIKEPEATENPQSNAKKPQKPSQYTKQIKTKSIPPPLRNRSRRKLQQWIWLTVSCMIVIALFFLGNIGFFSNLKPRRSPGF